MKDRFPHQIRGHLGLYPIEMGKPMDNALFY
jgi:hypothetical protein